MCFRIANVTLAACAYAYASSAALAQRRARGRGRPGRAGMHVRSGLWGQSPKYVCTHVGPRAVYVVRGKT